MTKATLRLLLMLFVVSFRAYLVIFWKALIPGHKKASLPRWPCLGQKCNLTRDFGNWSSWSLSGGSRAPHTDLKIIMHNPFKKSIVYWKGQKFKLSAQGQDLAPFFQQCILSAFRSFFVRSTWRGTLAIGPHDLLVAAVGRSTQISK